MINQEHQAALNEVLDLVDDWQKEGRNGHCLPVIRGKFLANLEALADERRRDECSVCEGSGEVGYSPDLFPCSHCTPLAGS